MDYRVNQTTDPAYCGEYLPIFPKCVVLMLGCSGQNWSWRRTDDKAFAKLPPGHMGQPTGQTADVTGAAAIRTRVNIAFCRLPRTSRKERCTVQALPSVPNSNRDRYVILQNSDADSRLLARWSLQEESLDARRVRPSINQAAVGISNVNRVASPVETTVILPPWAFAISFTINKPRPSPF